MDSSAGEHTSHEQTHFAGGIPSPSTPLWEDFSPKSSQDGENPPENPWTTRTIHRCHQHEATITAPMAAAKIDALQTFGTRRPVWVGRDLQRFWSKPLMPKPDLAGGCLEQFGCGGAGPKGRSTHEIRAGWALSARDTKPRDSIRRLF